MRHLAFIFVAVLAAYGLWQLGGRHSLHRWARHGVRLGAVLALLLTALVLAYNSTALKLL